MSVSDSSDDSLEQLFQLPPTPRTSNINNTTMPDSNTSQTATLNLTRVVNLPTTVLKFKGTVQNKHVEPKVDRWITSLEQHFSREGIISDIEKIRESKRFVDPKEGNALDTITYNPRLTDVSDWKVFKETLTNYYQEVKECQPLFSLDKVCQLKWDEGKEDFTDFLSRSNKTVAIALKSIKDKFNISFSMEQREILTACQIYRNLAPNAAATLEKKIDPKEDISIALNKVKQAHRELGKGKPSVQVKMVNQSLPKPPPQQAMSQIDKPTKEEYSGPRITCYNCGKSGHGLKQCIIKAYCTYCKVGGHRRGENVKCKDYAPAGYRPRNIEPKFINKKESGVLKRTPQGKLIRVLEVEETAEVLEEEMCQAVGNFSFLGEN